MLIVIVGDELLRWRAGASDYWLRMAQIHDLRDITLVCFSILVCGCIVLLAALILRRIYPPEEPRINKVVLPLTYLWLSILMAASMSEDYLWQLYLNRHWGEDLVLLSTICMCALYYSVCWLRAKPY
jgi:hypothetical protein